MMGLELKNRFNKVLSQDSSYVKVSDDYSLYHSSFDNFTTDDVEIVNYPENCRTINESLECLVARDSMIYYYDTNHVTQFGYEALASAIISNINNETKN